MFAISVILITLQSVKSTYKLDIEQSILKDNTFIYVNIIELKVNRCRTEGDNKLGIAARLKNWELK